jgi:ribose-phosphate pyrophosphokinase
MILNLDKNFKPFASEQEIEFQSFTFSGGEPHIKINSNFGVNQAVTITHRLNSFNDLDRKSVV